MIYVVEFEGKPLERSRKVYAYSERKTAEYAINALGGVVRPYTAADEVASQNEELERAHAALGAELAALQEEFKELRRRCRAEDGESLRSRIDQMACDQRRWHKLLHHAQLLLGGAQ